MRIILMLSVLIAGCETMVVDAPHCDELRPVCPVIDGVVARASCEPAHVEGRSVVGPDLRAVCASTATGDFEWWCVAYDQPSALASPGTPSCLYPPEENFERCDDCLVTCRTHSDGVTFLECTRGGVAVASSGFHCVEEGGPLAEMIYAGCWDGTNPTCRRMGGEPTEFDLATPQCAGVATGE